MLISDLDLKNFWAKATNFCKVKAKGKKGKFVNANIGVGTVRAQCLFDIDSEEAIAFETDKGNWYLIGSSSDTENNQNTRQIVFRQVRPKKKKGARVLILFYEKLENYHIFYLFEDGNKEEVFKLEAKPEYEPIYFNGHIHAYDDNYDFLINIVSDSGVYDSRYISYINDTETQKQYSLLEARLIPDFYKGNIFLDRGYYYSLASISDDPLTGTYYDDSGLPDINLTGSYTPIEDTWQADGKFNILYKTDFVSLNFSDSYSYISSGSTNTYNFHYSKETFLIDSYGDKSYDIAIGNSYIPNPALPSSNILTSKNINWNYSNSEILFNWQEAYIIENKNVESKYQWTRDSSGSYDVNFISGSETVNYIYKNSGLEFALKRSRDIFFYRINSDVSVSLNLKTINIADNREHLETIYLPSSSTSTPNFRDVYYPYSLSGFDISLYPSINFEGQEVFLIKKKSETTSWLVNAKIENLSVSVDNLRKNHTFQLNLGGSISEIQDDTKFYASGENLAVNISLKISSIQELPFLHPLANEKGMIISNNHSVEAFLTYLNFFDFYTVDTVYPLFNNDVFEQHIENSNYYSKYNLDSSGSVALEQTTLKDNIIYVPYYSEEGLQNTGSKVYVEQWEIESDGSIKRLEEILEEDISPINPVGQNFSKISLSYSPEG